MNRRQWVRAGSAAVVLALGLAAATATAPALGQAAPPPPVGTPAITPLDSSIKKMTDPASKTPKIREFLDSCVLAMTSDKEDARKYGRDTLIAAVRGGSQPFAMLFGSELAASVKPTLNNAQTPNGVRVKIATVVEAVAQAKGYGVEPAVEQLLADHDASVVLVALKAAKPVLADALQPQNGNATALALTKAIVAGAKAHLKTASIGGYVAMDAYEALRVDPAVFGSAPPAQVAKQLDMTVDPILELLEARTAEYATGVPAEPEAEQNMPTRLYYVYQNGALTAAQRKRAVQDLVELVSACGQRATTASKLHYRQMIPTVKNSAQAIKQLLAPPGGAAGGVAVVGGLGVEQLSNISFNTPPDKVRDEATRVPPTVRLNADFKDLTDPPKLDPVDPEPEPGAAPRPPA